MLSPYHWFAFSHGIYVLTWDLRSHMGFYSRLETPDLFSFDLKYIFPMWKQASQRENSWLTEPFLETLILIWLKIFDYG